MSANGNGSKPAVAPKDEETVERPASENPRMMGGRMGAAGMPLERSKDFSGSIRRLAAVMAPERLGVIGVIGLAVVSVTLLVLGPKILGNATQTIVDGVMAGFKHTGGIDFDQLHRILLLAVAVYVVGTVLSYFQGYLLAGVVQRSMLRLRADVESKLNRMPLSHVDRQPRGDMLSRVTNDIDNLAQSLQQTLSQLLSSSLQIVGVVVMMFTVSWQLAMVTVLIIPVTIFTMRFITSRSKKRFVDQWRHTGTLNAQVEEAFTGHSLVKVYNRQADVEARFRAKNDELYDASAAAQFMSGSIQPAVMFLGNVNYVVIALLGGLLVTNGSMNIGDIQAFIQYSRQFTQPLTTMAS
ncbi:MAG: ABC transporter ATP-binding protein, partial [Actinobacteria bacterium]|nr:ABC transporter ATP-binding protein [Actinomycetota bacterium]